VIRPSLRAFLGGSAVTSAAVLIPRGASVGAQWLLTAVAGTAAVADYVAITYRGSAAVSLFAVGLAPILAAHQRSLASPRVRIFVGGALLALSAAAFALTFLFEAVIGGGVARGGWVAFYAATTVQACASVTLWAVLQRGRAFGPTLLASAGLSVLVAASTLTGRASVVTVGIGLLGALPGLALLGPLSPPGSLRRTLRYAWALLIRSIPIALPACWGAILITVSVSRGSAVLGQSAVGVQALYWSLATVFNVVSQNVAVRALRDASEAGRPERAGRWLPYGALLVAAAAVLQIAFAAVMHRRGSADVPPLGEAWVAATSILSDPLSYFFCPPSGRLRVAIGSGVVSVLLLALLAVRPELLLRPFGVFGPLGIMGAARLLFVPGHGTRAMRAALLAVFAVTAGLLVVATRGGA
jgi:hypothetical protein